jgi:pilus assembly protein Flp/PilA
VLSLLRPMLLWLGWFRNDSKGQSMTEYALILALIAVVVIAILTTMGETIRDVFTEINDSLQGVLQ